MRKFLDMASVYDGMRTLSETIEVWQSLTQYDDYEDLLALDCNEEDRKRLEKAFYHLAKASDIIKDCCKSAERPCVKNVQHKTSSVKSR